jgi:fatty acid desaturase
LPSPSTAWVLSDHAAIHELSHGTPFKSKELNAFFPGFFSFITLT